MTSNASEILRRRYVKNDPEREARIERYRGDSDVARQIFELRTRAGLTQAQLAKCVGTTASVICRLEDADYKGHSLTMLRRIAAALEINLSVRLESGVGTTGHRSSTTVNVLFPLSLDYGSRIVPVQGRTSTTSTWFRWSAEWATGGAKMPDGGTTHA